MSHPKIGRALNPLVVAPTRRHETPRPVVSFQNLMRGGAAVLLAGAKVATRLVGAPILSAAIPDQPAINSVGQSAGGDPLDAAESLQRQRMGDELKLLALQDQIQRENRQVTLVSNVMKARHDTDKAAIGNIRA